LQDSHGFCALVKEAAKTIGILEFMELTEILLYFDRIGGVIYVDEEVFT
jgi:hypothetical protein